MLINTHSVYEVLAPIDFALDLTNNSTKNVYNMRLKHKIHHEYKLYYLKNLIFLRG